MSKLSITPQSDGTFRVVKHAPMDLEIHELDADDVYDFFMRYMEETAGPAPESLHEPFVDAEYDFTGHRSHANDAEPGYFGVASS